jgi:hypothetical protein
MRRSKYGVGSLLWALPRWPVQVVTIEYPATDHNIDALPFEPPPCPECGSVYVEIHAAPDPFDKHYILECATGHLVNVGRATVNGPHVNVDGKGPCIVAWHLGSK